jgi:sulfur relay (sulfurtransferase) DsrC/TusE family protein
MNVLVLIVVIVFLINGKIGEKIVRQYYAAYNASSQIITIYKACPSESGSDKFMQRFI